MSEVLDLVDVQDNIVGACSRADQGKSGVITRNVVVFLTDSKGKHIVQVRSKKKDRWPGCFDFAACGSVKQGESYEAAAARELHEEIGVRCALHPLFKHYREVPRQGSVMRLFTTYFKGVSDGPFKTTPEVDEVLVLSAQQIEQFIAIKDARVQAYFLDEWKIIAGARRS